MSEGGYVLDASAILASLYAEAGADRVDALLKGACISAVNFAEVVTKFAGEGVAADTIAGILGALDLDVVAFGSDQAVRAGLLRASTRHLGLSLGDRACLALAEARGATAVTADRAWEKVEGPIEVLCIR